MEGDIQRHHRTPPQHHLQGLRGGDGIEERVSKLLKQNVEGSCVKEQNQLLGEDLEQEPNQEQEAGSKDGDGADLGRNFMKVFKPGS